MVRIGFLAAHFKLEPYSGNHPAFTYFFESVPESIGEQRFTKLPVAHAVAPVPAILLVPAAVYYKVLYTTSFQYFSSPPYIVIRRISPCRAELVENNREIVFG